MIEYSKAASWLKGHKKEAGKFVLDAKRGGDIFPLKFSGLASMTTDEQGD